MRFLLGLAIFFNFIVPLAGAASSWRIEPQGDLPSDKLQELQHLWPKIENNIDLNNLMNEISRQGSFELVEAYQSGSQITIRVKRAYEIHRLSIHTTTREFKKKIQSLMHVYKNQVDSVEVRKRIERDILAYLHGLGFLKAKVNITSFPANDQETKLIVSVDEDFPCLIRDIQLGFKIPGGVDFPLEIGDICDSSKIDGAIRDFKESLTLEGYNQYKILPPEIRFDPPSNSALIYIAGTIGKKINGKVRSPLANPPLIRLILGDNLHTLDETITDPNTMRTEIYRKFQDSGYQDVKVKEPETSRPKADEVLYTFNVEPGPEYKITEVQIEGLTALQKNEALEAMGLFPSFGNPPLLTEPNIRQAIDSLSNTYSERGFWNVKVYYPKIKKNPSTADAKLSFVITEGKRRVFESLSIRGNRAFTEEKIKEYFDVKPQQPLTWRSIVTLQQDLQKLYRDVGYLYAKIKIDLIQNRRFRDIQTKVSLSIEEGPRVKIGEITIKGLIKTKDYVVTRELLFQEGDWYSPQDIDDSRQALIDLGLFSSISISATDSSDFSEERLIIPYTVTVREAKPGQVSFGPGWSYEDGGRFSMDSSYNNIEGTARQVFFNGSYSQEISQSSIGNRNLLGYNLGLGYIEPYLLDLPVNGILTFSQGAEATDQQWELTKSIQATLAHKYWISSNKLRSELFTLYKTTQEKAEESVSVAFKTDEIQIREAGVRTIWDTRNDLGWPTRGGVINAETSWADFILGGDTKYFHWALSTSKYLQLAKSLVFASRVSFESFTNVIRSETSFDILPTSERIKSGGAESNRGFKLGDLGPVVEYTTIDGDDVTTEQLRAGGTQAFAMALELRLQLSNSFGMTAFVDSSNTFLTKKEEALFKNELSGDTSLVEPNLYDNNRYEFYNLLKDPSLIWKRNYISYGLAANYLTPLGSINVSYGFPVDRCPMEGECQVKRGNSSYKSIRGGQLQINVGTNF